MTSLNTRQIFIGGTQRSGSTVCGYLVGKHPDVWATMPREIRFLTDPGGLLDLVFGVRSRIDAQVETRLADIFRKLQGQGRFAIFPPTPDRFMQDLQGKWWLRMSPDGQPRGLHRGIDAEVILGAVRRFEAGYPKNPLEAARELVDDVLTPATNAASKTIWADTTPQNAENAHRLVRLNPDARIIFMVRDGRDTCASILNKQWGPLEPLDALEWWRKQAIRAHTAILQAGKHSALTVVLEDLVLHRRDTEIRRLFEHLDLEITPAVHSFFETRVTAERANIGRWRDDIPASAIPRFARRYAQIHTELTSLGLRLPAAD